MQPLDADGEAGPRPGDEQDEPTSQISNAAPAKLNRLSMFTPPSQIRQNAMKAVQTTI